MNHIYELSNAGLEQPSIVTIGVFDGVHRGHRHLLDGLVQTARTRGLLAVVLTLFPHPDIVLRHLSGRYYLTTPEQQAVQLGSLGIDVVVTQTFDEQLRHIRAAAFVDQLRQHLQMVELWITTDFALGYQREGNFDFLSAQGREKGFEVRASDLLDINGTHQAISSSAIREALQRGSVEQAANWLGRPYRLEGKVVHGDHRGRELGFPTANVDAWAEQVLPANGIYACRATLGSEQFMAATSVGERPTFDGKDVRVEAYLLDFDRVIYGQTLALDFVARLRDEKRFESIETLIEQIEKDVEVTRSLLTSQQA